MASLTEAYLISDILRRANNDNWYDRVYLCIEKDKKNEKIIQGFNCYLFRDFNDADNYKKTMKMPLDKRVVSIPMCKWIPEFLHKYYLNKNLRDIYWKQNITLYRRPIIRK